MSSMSDGFSPSQPNEAGLSNSLWNYVTRLDKISDAGGNMMWQCKFYGVTKKSSYTRVRGHFLNLPFLLEMDLVLKRQLKTLLLCKD